MTIIIYDYNLCCLSCVIIWVKVVKPFTIIYYNLCQDIEDMEGWQLKPLLVFVFHFQSNVIFAFGVTSISMTSQRDI